MAEGLKTELQLEVDQAKLTAATGAIGTAVTDAVTKASAATESLGMLWAKYVNQELIKAEKEAKKLATETERAERAAAKLAEKTQLKENVARAKEEAKNLADETKRAEAAAKKLESAYSSVGGVIMKLGGMIAGFFGGKAIYDTMVEMQRAQATFTGILGSAQLAESTLGTLRQYAVDTGFSFAALTRAARGFYQAGLETNQVNDLLGRMHDIAGNDTDTFRQLGEAINKSYANMGKIERSTIFSLSRAGFNPIALIAQMRGQSLEEFNASATSIAQADIRVEELIKAIRIATSEGGMLFGNAARQAMTLDGRIESLIGTVRTQLASALDRMSPYLSKIVLAIQNLFEAFMAVGKQVWYVYGRPIFAAVVGISRAFNYLTQYVKEHSDTVSTVLRGLGYGFGWLTIFIIASLIKIGQRLAIFATEFVVAMSALSNSIRGVGNASVEAGVKIQGLTLEQKFAQKEALKQAGTNGILIGTLKGIGLAARSAARGMTAFKIATGVGAALAVADLAYTIYDTKKTMEDQGMFNAIIGDKDAAMEDITKSLKTLTQNIDLDITQNNTINAPLDKKGRTNLTADEVQHVLEVSRGNFSQELQKIMMEASKP
jgi:hypothetical protein